MSKGLFELMQMKEIETTNFLPSKKEVVKATTNFITDLLDSGEYNIHELLSQAKRASESLEVINNEILKRLPQENFEAFGLKGTFRNGGEKLNFSECEIYTQLQNDLKERENLLKLAQTQTIFDGYGNEVPKVSSAQIKSSLSISF